MRADEFVVKLLQEKEDLIQKQEERIEQLCNEKQTVMDGEIAVLKEEHYSIWMYELMSPSDIKQFGKEDGNVEKLKAALTDDELLLKLYYYDYYNRYFVHIYERRPQYKIIYREAEIYIDLYESNNEACVITYNGAKMGIFQSYEDAKEAALKEIRERIQICLDKYFKED